MNPFSSPIRRSRRWPALLADLGELACARRCRLRVEDAAVIVGHDLDEALEARLPVSEHPLCYLGPGPLEVLGDECAQLDRVGLVELLEGDAPAVTAPC